MPFIEFLCLALVAILFGEVSGCTFRRQDSVSQPFVGKDVQIHLQFMPFTEKDNKAYLYFVA